MFLYNQYKNPTETSRCHGKNPSRLLVDCLFFFFLVHWTRGEDHGHARLRAIHRGEPPGAWPDPAAAGGGPPRDGQGGEQMGAGPELPGCDAAGAPGGGAGADGGGADGLPPAGARGTERSGGIHAEPFDDLPGQRAEGAAALLAAAGGGAGAAGGDCCGGGMGADDRVQGLLVLFHRPEGDSGWCELYLHRRPQHGPPAAAPLR